MISQKALFFLAGVAAGAGAVCFVKSAAGRKTAVAIAAKGLELKNCVAKAVERTKETASDIAAEAKHSLESKTDA
ncbi:MAG: DUF6110 family protein [Synergistaceae bacterium]|jgi:hypothetical protein|nr:DUF6110 family protein [Synergistaceae bacterium]